MTRVRLAAVNVLLAVERGRTTLAAAVDHERQTIDDDRDRALLVELTAGALRWRGELDALLNQCSRRPIHELDAGVRAILRLAAYQLRHLDRVPAHAILNESVDLTRAIGRPQAAGFVNGVLRSLVRRQSTLSLPVRPPATAPLAAQVDYLATTLSHPLWLVTRWLERYGFDAVERWCRFNNDVPDITVRSSGRLRADEVLAALRAANAAATPAPFVLEAIRLPPGSLGGVPATLAAEILVQDEASQIVAHTVGARPGERVLDLCAAPGGKTVVLWADLRGDGLLVAADSRPARIRLLRSTVHRARARAFVVLLNATRAVPFGAIFDRVLVDAPCSGLGTIRRDPDLKWARHPEDLLGFAEMQRAMLRSAAEAVRPGGTLVYATCSSEPEENDQIVHDFLGRDTRFALVPADPGPAVRAADLVDPRGMLRTLPFKHDLDAFFAAVLVRRRSA